MSQGKDSVVFDDTAPVLTWKDLLGKKVVAVRKMTRKELSLVGWPANMWAGPPMAICLEGGIKIFASQDDEMNGPGTFVFDQED